MKKNLLFILALVISQIVSAQTIQLIDKDNNVNPDTVIVTGEYNVTLAAPLRVVNLTNDSIHVIVLKNDVDVVQGALSTFCWNKCFTSATVKRSDTVTIFKKDTVDRFTADYKPKSTRGRSTVIYTFVDFDNNEAILDSVVVIFESGLDAINTITTNSTLSNPYPNPANNYARFNYSIDRSVNEAKVEVTDLLGTKVAATELNSLEGVAEINTSNLKAGFYFYSFVIDGKTTLTRKMIVRH